MAVTDDWYSLRLVGDCVWGENDACESLSPSGKGSFIRGRHALFVVLREEVMHPAL